jgi:PAS domain S-box-containing protein
LTNINIEGLFNEYFCIGINFLMERNMKMEKKQLLAELHKKMIAEIQDYAIILLDIDGTILSWNKGVERIKGYKEHEILGQNFRIFYLPQDRQYGLPEQLLGLAMREGRARHIGKRVRKDGTTFWGSIHITALHDNDGQVIGFTKLTREMADNEKI